MAMVLVMTTLALISTATASSMIDTGVHGAQNPGLSAPLGSGGDSSGDIVAGLTSDPTEEMVLLFARADESTTKNPASASREVTCNDCHSIAATALRTPASSARQSTETDAGIALGGEPFRAENDGQHEHVGISIPIAGDKMT